MKSTDNTTHVEMAALGRAVAGAGLGQPRGAELPAPATPAGPIQSALLFRPDGSAELTAEPAHVAKRNHRGLRGDARRTAEYLASRGATPAESLHSVAKLAWRVAVRELVKELRCSPEVAFRLWVSCNETLLPYTSSRINPLDLGDLGPLGAAGAGGFALAHYLAASAMSAKLGAGMSPDTRSVDRIVDVVPDDRTADQPNAAGLPPKASD